MMGLQGGVMYLRHTTVTKNGKTHTYWRLVRSVRTGRKVRQETVAQLGELDDQGRLEARALAEQLAGLERQPGLFDDDLPADPIPLDLRALRLERGRRFGDVWLAHRLWQALGFDRLLEELLPRGREHVAWSTMAAVLVIARLCEPSSELHIAEDWFRRTALDDLLGVPEAKIDDNRCYRGLDKLFELKEALEKHVKVRLGSMFQLEYDILLYDVTSTYFEGEARANPKAQRGHSRDHRSDCKQVCIGLVVTRDGFPLGFEVFAGNRHDSTTLREIVERMESRYGQSSRVWALDRGMVSEKHLDWLRERGSRYIVGTPKSQLAAHERQLLDGEWSLVRDGLKVQIVPASDGNEVYLLCRSEDRAAKEQAMRERFAQRIETALAKLKSGCEKRKCQTGVIERSDRLVQARRSVDVRRRSRRMLSAPQQRDRMDGRRTVAGLHATHSGRGGLSDQEGSTRTSSGLAPDREACQRTHPGLFPGLRAVQDAGRMVSESGDRFQRTNGVGGNGANPEYRRGGTNPGRPRSEVALCGASGSSPVDSDRAAGPGTAATLAAAARAEPIELKSEKSTKCSANSTGSFVDK
jgi:hypothetical protein